MEIRIATTGDIDQIALLFTEQFAIQASLQPYLMQNGTQNKKFIEHTITDTDSEIFIAIDENKIIGFATIFEKKSDDFNFMVQHKYAYLMDIIITKEQQGKGIATKLMNEIKQWALDRDLDYIELAVAANNSAIDFYKKSGYVEVKRTMIYKLS